MLANQECSTQELGYSAWPMCHRHLPVPLDTAGRMQEPEGEVSWSLEYSSLYKHLGRGRRSSKHTFKKKPFPICKHHILCGMKHVVGQLRWAFEVVEKTKNGPFLGT